MTFRQLFVTLSFAGIFGGIVHADALMDLPNNSTGYALLTPPPSGVIPGFGIGWSQTGRYTDVSISAWLATDQSAIAGAYLLDTGFNIIDKADNIAVAGSTLSDAAHTVLTRTDIFSGLSLGPGNYYMLIVLSSGSDLAIGFSNQVGEVEAPGVADLGGYSGGFNGTIANPSVINVLNTVAYAAVTITGDRVETQQAETPEPSSLILAGLGSVLLPVFRLRRARLSSTR